MSSEHAAISWIDGSWEVRDLGSRNGTVLDAHRLAAGARIVVRRGSVLRFGSSDEQWVLCDDRPPEVLGIDLDSGELFVGEHGLLRLSEEITLLTEDGVRYWLEEAGSRTEVRDRQIAQIGDRRVRLSLPSAPASQGRTVTAEGVLLNKDITLRFHVSPDEEHVSIRLVAPGVDLELRPRSFDYMLLALARARLEDAASAVEPSEQGWVFTDELARSLGIDVSHVNVDIYRARRRFADAGVQGADEIIARRTHTRALRLACGRVEIA